MNDLSGLTWGYASNQSGKASATSHASTSTFANISRQSTPISAPQSGRSTPAPAGHGPGAGVATKKNDTFANLLGSGAPKTQAGQSLQERQRQLLEDKARQAAAQQKTAEQQYRANDASFWEGLGGSSSGRATPGAAERVAHPPRATDDDDADLLAGFSAATPVDASSHYPPPTSSSSALASRDTSVSRHPSPLPQSKSPLSVTDFPDDDDPFGLNQFAQKRSSPQPQVTVQSNDDDDILGDLAKPVRSVPAKPSPPPGTSSNPRDKAVAELVDMGFPIEKATAALAATDTGADVQAAVSIILSQAHEQSRSRSRPTREREREREREHEPQSGRESSQPNGEAAWARNTQSKDKDPGQYASELGTAFFKSANSLWKTGQKRVQKAMADFQVQQEGNDGQPKWMREARQNAREDEAESRNATNEAMALESGRALPSRPSKPSRTSDERPPPKPARPSAPTPVSARERLSRQAVEEQSAQAYVSPARRRKPQPPPPEPSKPAMLADPEMDIFADEQPAPTLRPPSKSSAAPSRPPAKASPVPTRPKAPTRNVPALPPAVLAQSTSHRQAGTDAFKRGDFASATNSYTAALGQLPPTHPLTIILRCNRALTYIKTGDPKAALADADAALQTIGPSRGDDEAIDLDGSAKPMKDFFSKALSRKAEALEHMEKWSDAAAVWHEAVAAGVGGTLAIQGRSRCERAAAPKQPTARPTAPAPKKTAPKPRPSALNDLAGQDSAAVKRLRAQHAAAAAASDEQFALADGVAARLDAWRAGKQDNLRALLASLDAVLWADAGWAKVGMADLVLPNRVKIVYMKAIARVHPDKIPQSATTEQRMVSASVFATLNEAWDGFKTQNNL